MTRADAKRLKLTRSIEEAHAMADAVLERARAAKVRTAPRRKAGAEKKRNEEEREAAFYTEAKRQAAERACEVSNEHLGPRCEYVIGIPGVAKRCPEAANDPDHVIGGAYRKDCEALGAEGLECLCRGHHDLKHANAPSRDFWLRHAEEHALRHGYRRLISLIARARAKYEAKHPKETPHVR